MSNLSMEQSRNKKKTPFWLWLNLLSLDAPLVGVAWMWMLSKALRVGYLQSASWLVLPLAIWCVYALDRVIDAWRCHELRDESPRHAFHWRWRWIVIGLVFIGIGTCIYHGLYVLPRSMFTAGIVTAFFCAFYFLVAMALGTASKYSDMASVQVTMYSKNFLAGMIFAMGVGIPVQAATTALLATDLQSVLDAFASGVGVIKNIIQLFLTTLYLIFMGAREIWVFGLLCMMNIMAIDLWEKAEVEKDENTAYVHESTLTLGLIVLAGGSLLFAAVYADEYSKLFFYAVMVAAALLQVINHYRERFSMNALRVLADAALIAPLPIFLFS